MTHTHTRCCVCAPLARQSQPEPDAEEIKAAETRRREREAATARKLAERDAKTRRRLEELRLRRTEAASAAEAATAAEEAKPTTPVPVRDPLRSSGGGGGGGGDDDDDSAAWSEERYLRRITECIPRLSWACVAPSQYTAETSKSACTVLSVQAALDLMAVPYSPVRRSGWSRRHATAVRWCPRVAFCCAGRAVPHTLKAVGVLIVAALALVIGGWRARCAGPPGED
jgi:hypothetical protein